MGVIVLHAGMAKAGSSSIQRWLANNCALLASGYGVHPMRVVEREEEAAHDVVASTPSEVLSRLVGVQDPYADAEPVSTRRKAAREVFERLDALARDCGTIVLTEEGYQLAFWNRDEAFLSELDELARVHRVRIAYYVRPQHTAMEAAWRQWGFRLPMRPSKYFERRIQLFDYFQTLEQVQEVAPNVSFEMRPFRDDLLAGGDVVRDFATTFLGVGDLASDMAEEGRANQGLPLDLVILLRAGKERFWRSHHDNETLDQLRDVVTRWDVPESDEVRRSRRVLQGFCHRRFEAGNQQLIARLGWNTRSFVPPVEDAATSDRADDLTALDDLWSSAASDTERELVFCALDAVLAQTELGADLPAPEPLARDDGSDSLDPPRNGRVRTIARQAIRTLRRRRRSASWE